MSGLYYNVLVWIHRAVLFKVASNSTVPHVMCLRCYLVMHHVWSHIKKMIRILVVRYCAMHTKLQALSKLTLT